MNLLNYPAVSAYILARRTGDDATCKRIVNEVIARDADPASDGMEVAALQTASANVPLARHGN